MHELEPLAPHPDQHLRAMGQLAADAFSGGKYVDAFCDNYIGNSNYDWDVSRVVFDGGKLVHHWGVWGYDMRVGSTPLRVGGIGAVVTHPDDRKQGLMHRAADDSFRAMAERGYHLSILRGRHYVKMGYARAWNYATWRFRLPGSPPGDVPSRDVPLAALPAYEGLGPASIPAMDALYNRTHETFPGTAVRPTFRNKHSDDLGVYAWRRDGSLAGYVRALPDEADPKTLMCYEAAGDPGQALVVLDDLFRRGGYEKVACFTLPHAHPLLQVLRAGTCTVESRYFDITGWRVRLIDLEGALAALIPVLEGRIAESHFAAWQGALLLDAGEQRAALEIDRGKIAVSRHASTPHSLEGGWDIARFLIGSDEPGEIIRQADMACTGLAGPLSQVLFPNLHPMLSHWDEF